MPLTSHSSTSLAGPPLTICSLRQPEQIQKVNQCASDRAAILRRVSLEEIIRPLKEWTALPCVVFPSFLQINKKIFNHIRLLPDLIYLLLVYISRVAIVRRAKLALVPSLFCSFQPRHEPICMPASKLLSDHTFAVSLVVRRKALKEAIDLGSCNIVKYAAPDRPRNEICRRVVGGCCRSIRRVKVSSLGLIASVECPAEDVYNRRAESIQPRGSIEEGYKKEGGV